MDFDIYIRHLRSRDGAELYERKFSAGELFDLGRFRRSNERYAKVHQLPETAMKRILASAPTGGAPGQCIRFKSDDVAVRAIHTVNHRDTLGLKFAAANTDAELVNFVSEYGFPFEAGGYFYDPSAEEREALERNERIVDELLKGVPLWRIREEQIRIARLAQPKSNKDFANQFYSGVSMHVSTPKGQTRPHLTAYPNTLIDFMKLEIASIVCDVDRRTCAHCGTIFALGGEKAKRTDSKYCSSNCRLKAYRKRKKSRKEKS